MTIIQYCASSCNISIVIQSLYSLASYSDFICSRSHHRKQCRLHGIATSSIFLFEISLHVDVGSDGTDGIYIVRCLTTGCRPVVKHISRVCIGCEYKFCALLNLCSGGHHIVITILDFHRPVFCRSSDGEFLLVGRRVGINLDIRRTRLYARVVHCSLAVIVACGLRNELSLCGSLYGSISIGVIPLVCRIGCTRATHLHFGSRSSRLRKVVSWLQVIREENLSTTVLILISALIFRCRHDETAEHLALGEVVFLGHNFCIRAKNIVILRTVTIVFTTQSCRTGATPYIYSTVSLWSDKIVHDSFKCLFGGTPVCVSEQSQADSLEKGCREDCCSGCLNIIIVRGSPTIAGIIIACFIITFLVHHLIPTASCLVLPLYDSSGKGIKMALQGFIVFGILLIVVLHCLKSVNQGKEIPRISTPPESGRVINRSIGTVADTSPCIIGLC